MDGWGGPMCQKRAEGDDGGAFEHDGSFTEDNLRSGFDATREVLNLDKPLSEVLCIGR